MSCTTQKRLVTAITDEVLTYTNPTSSSRRKGSPTPNWRGRRRSNLG
jgi:hypothetical protein